MTAGGGHGTEGRAVSEDSISDELRAWLTMAKNQRRSVARMPQYGHEYRARHARIADELDALLSGGGPVEPPDDAPKFPTATDVVCWWSPTYIDSPENMGRQALHGDDCWKSHPVCALARIYGEMLSEIERLRAAGRAAGSDARATSEPDGGKP